MHTELLLQSPSNSNVMYTALSQLATDAAYSRVRTALAFASRGGVSLLVASLTARTTPLSTSIVVGLDGYITEPRAIELLMAQFPGRVRCFESPEPETMFHAKTYCFDDEQPSGQVALLIGSSNLSSAGLIKNREGGLLLRLDAHEVNPARGVWDSWWHQIWTAANPATPALIARYATRFRRSSRPPAPDRKSGGREEQGQTDIGTATELWLGVQVTGGSSNQLEVPRDVVSFFQIDPNDQGGRLDLVFIGAGTTWTKSFMAYYVANSMWRINLDTDIPQVATRTLRGRFIRLRRTALPHTYELNVSTAAAILALRTASRALGNIRTTPSREYGWIQVEPSLPKGNPSGEIKQKG